MTLDAAEKAGVPVVYWAVHSRTGVHIGLWPDADDASKVFLEEYSDGTLTKLVPASALDTARAEIERLRQALKPFADTFRQHNDPGVSDLYNEQPVAWHVPLGAYRVAAPLSPAVKEPK